MPGAAHAVVGIDGARTTGPLRGASAQMVGDHPIACCGCRHVADDPAAHDGDGGA